MLQGAPVHTIDFDIVYALSEPNIHRLELALTELGLLFHNDPRRIVPSSSHLQSRGWDSVGSHCRGRSRDGSERARSRTRVLDAVFQAPAFVITECRAPYLRFTRAPKVLIERTKMSKVWFITGAGRGMGVDFARAALAAGHRVVATGRDTDRLKQALGSSRDVLPVAMDVTKPFEVQAAVRAAVDRFGRVDVLVNNAANFYAGYFEGLTPEQMDRQLATSLIGPMNVTRAVLPVMRQQRSGQIISISSSAGLAGFEFGSAYAASKFGLEGWMESLAPEIAPFGITTTIVNPGFFRTELLTPQSTAFATLALDDYGERRAGRAECRVDGSAPAEVWRALLEEFRAAANARGGPG